jgi:hypothetical protein
MSTELFQLRKRGIKLLLSAGLEDMKLNLQRTRCSRCLLQFEFLARISWICEIGNDAGGRHQILEEFETFRDEFIREHAHSGDIAARPVQARDKTGADWVGTSGEDDWDRGSRRLGRAC